ncbi:F-box domain protein [Aspergillus luchuensis]|uniref:F-box domain protein n=1 Tax=Aspergillus kawachii TaxID=1069201 RepID=A0A146FPE5_ASPKA|nr:F-box domain protein [Aspergillus luchuensis]
MPFHQLATELLLHIFRSCDSVTDVMNLAMTCRRLHTVFHRSNKLQILVDVAESEFGPLDDIIQIVTQNTSQRAHLFRTAPITNSLLKQIVQIGHVAQKWEIIYPVKKWKTDFENRRSLDDDERFRLRRAIYRLWLSPAGAPSLFEKDASSAEQYFHTAHPSNFTESPAKYKSRFRNDYFHDPGSEGWGDEIPHYYVVQDMLKLDPGQVIWLREHAPLKEQVETYVRSFGDWFRDNGETFGDTLEWVMKERGDDIDEFRAAIADREVGVVWD